MSATPPNGKQPPGREPRRLPRRVYKAVAVETDGAQWHLLLDGRRARTPSKHPLAVPTRAIADRLAAEWAAQGEHVEPATMPLTTLACSAIDAVAFQAAAVTAEIVKYAGSDLLCYREDGEKRLAAEQADAWDPVIAWAGTALGAHVTVATGIRHIDQPPSLPVAIARAVGQRHPLSLAALHVLTTITGSALLALAVDRGRLPLDDAWRVAHVDENWQIRRWGDDAEAMRRRAFRLAEARAAAFVLDTLRPA